MRLFSQARVVRHPGYLRVPVRGGHREPDDHVLHAARQSREDPDQERHAGGGEEQRRVVLRGAY